MSRFAQRPNDLLSIIEDTSPSAFPASIPPPGVVPGRPPKTRFGFLFPELQKNPAHQLLAAPATVANLIHLAGTMREAGHLNPSLDSDIPSAYNYFAQFLDHDISLEQGTQRVRLLDLDLAPLPKKEILALENSRSVTFDLDSVYGPAYDHHGQPYVVPRNGARMVVEQAVTLPPHNSRPGTDLPREANKPHLARIGDQRNDSHLIISQMHLAFLRAHNAILDRYPSNTYEQVQTILRQHYQWIVVNDFLNRVVDPTILREVLAGTRNVYPPAHELFMPLEFSVAAYRFGHSMIRNVYDYNAMFRAARLYQLLLMPGLLKDYHHIPDGWTIQWSKFLQGGTNVARKIKTCLVEPLASLPGAPDAQPIFSLAVRDLLRGYVLRLPTGQAVAQALGLPVMTATEIEDVGAAVSPEQKRVLQDPTTNFSKRTPLWFYVLAESHHFQIGLRLGPVGSSLVAGVLIELLKQSEDSYLLIPNWSPDPSLCETPGQFDLPALLRLADVLD